MHGAELTPTQYAHRRQKERQRYRAVLLAGLGVSALLHLATLLTLEFEFAQSWSDALPPPPRIIEIAPVMQAYDLVQVQVEVPPIDAQILERQQVRLSERTTLPAPADVPAYRPPTERFPSASVRERLQYRLGTRREIWRPAPADASVELSPEERLEQRVASRLQEYNDSMAAEAAARERALDWTTRDADGGRWGVSPGRIHLGGITLPAPFAFVPAPGRRDEIAGRRRDWTEIQAQASREEGRQVVEDRVRAIRERLDAERRARLRTDTTIVAPPPRPGGG